MKNDAQLALEAAESMAKRMKQDHIQAARDLARKLFSEDRIRLGQIGRAHV